MRKRCLLTDQSTKLFLASRFCQSIVTDLKELLEMHGERDRGMVDYMQGVQVNTQKLVLFVILLMTKRRR